MGYIDGRFDQVKGWGGESESLPPSTDLLFQITKVEQGTSQKGKPQMELDLLVLSQGELNGRGSKSWFTLDFTKDTPRKRIRQLIDACGIALDARGGFDDQHLLGKVFVGDVVHEPYKSDPDPVSGQSLDKVRVKIVNERPYTGPGAGSTAQQPAFQAAGAPPPGAYAPPPAGYAPPPGYAPPGAPTGYAPPPGAPQFAPPQQPQQFVPQQGAPVIARGAPALTRTT